MNTPTSRQRAGIGERISFGGVGARGFALSAAGDPDVWTKLSAAQQKWVTEMLANLNNRIYAATRTICRTWAPNITAAGGCFQQWFNSANMGLTKPDGSAVVLRTDGVFDQDTLDALRTVMGVYAKDFPTPWPGETAPATTIEEKKISTGAVVGIGVLGATVLGGIAYAATRKGGRKARRR